MSKTQESPIRLFHGTNRRFPSDATLLQSPEIQGSQPKTFATDCENTAIAYAVMKTKQDVHSKRGSLGSLYHLPLPPKIAAQIGSNELIVGFIENSKIFIKHLTAGDPRIYSFEQKAQKEQCHHEYSITPIELKNCQERKISGIYEAMRRGVQIYYINSEIGNRKGARNSLNIDIPNLLDSAQTIGDFFDTLELLEEKRIIIHANKLEGIRPFNYTTCRVDPSTRDMQSHATDGIGDWETRIKAEKANISPIKLNL